MLLHALAKRQHAAPVLCFFELRHVGRRRRGRRPEEVVENPFPASHDSRAIGQRRRREETALAKQPAPVDIGDGHTPEMASVNVRIGTVWRAVRSRTCNRRSENRGRSDSP